MFRTLRTTSGYTLVEVLAVAALVIILSAIAIPTGLLHVEEHRLDGAARYVATVFMAARAQAVRRSAFVAVRFQADAKAADIGFRTYVDGNANGVRTTDIAAGLDPPLGPVEHLPDRFEGIRFGIGPEVAGIDQGDVLIAGSDPIRVGPAKLVSFNPNGSVTSGTVYIRSNHGQRAVRLLGATGRTRLLAFWFPEDRWIDQ